MSRASNSTTKVSWRAPESLGDAAICELSGYQKDIDSATPFIQQCLPGSGEYTIIATHLYVVQVACFKSVNNGCGSPASKQLMKSQELEFLPSKYEAFN